MSALVVKIQMKAEFRDQFIEEMKADAIETHKKMPHFVKWLEATKDWLAAPLEIMPCNLIYPPANAWEKRPAPKM